jgi:hypothetical protein
MLGSFGFHRRFLCALHFMAGIALGGFWPTRADILVSTNSTWRYFKGTAEASDPTNAWREMKFDDSAWLVGEAPFHYGPNPICGGGDDAITGGVTNCAFGGTILSDMLSNYSCIFMRQTFVVPDTSVVATLSFRLSVDDGMAVWINGKVSRAPVGITGFTYTNTASPPREATTFVRTDISGFITNLVNGTNVICVQAFNANLTNDDFRIDVELVSSDLRPFPLTANQRGTVTCLESTNIRYDVYLPPAYSVDGEPLPILYTMNPDGGGMVGQFQSVCSNLNIIAIGVMGPRNGTGWDVHFREFFAVSRDVRQRVLFDPTAEFASGFSGGGESAYYFSRFRAQHVAGVFGMAGWLGRTLNTYYSTDRVQTNLLIARATGTTDTAGNYYVPLDSNYLASVGAVIRDWAFPGGHQVPPDTVKFDCLSWLLSRRTPAGPNDRANAAAQAVDWRARLVSGERQSVLLDCASALMNRPRTWDAYQAQLILDRLTADYASFRSIDYTPLPYGVFSSDQFYYYGRGAALAGDLARYRSCLKALTWIGSINGDRSGDLQALLAQFGYPIPAFQWSADRTIGQLSLWMIKDAPRLDGVLQSRTNLAVGVWQDLRVPFSGNDMIWTWELPLSPDAPSVFFRVGIAPRIGYSPPWP